jgi:elongation factor Ts
MNITIDQIKELRNATGAGVSAVREALEKSQGDMTEAVKYLREKGMAKAEKRKGNEINQGILGTYLHSNSKLIVVVEVGCETDFAAKSPDMGKFAQDLALHIAAVNPKYISVESVDADVLKTEKEIAQNGLEGKPENIKETIIAGKLEKFFTENVLLKQQLFSDETKTVQDYLSEMVAKIGEKIIISRFYKIQIGEETVYSNSVI